MITRFYSYEEASIYAGVMQSEGHYAVVLDDVIGFFYGPLFVNGFRVLVSDEPVEEEEPLPAEPLQENGLLEAVRVTFFTLMVGGLLFIALGLPFGLLMLLRGLSQNSRSVSDLLPVLTCILPLVVLPVLWAVLGPLMGSMNRTLRDESSVIGWAFRGMAMIWVATQLLWLVFILLMIAWWFIHGGTAGGMFRE